MKKDDEEKQNKKPKPYLDALDGLRGVATIMVVLYHIFEIYTWNNRSKQFINHGYLAVDFFFLLSGFVTSYAYDDKWEKMSLCSFIKRRLIRLHPMVIIGQVIALLLYSFTDCDFFFLVDPSPVWKILLVFAVGLFVLPVSKSLDVRGPGENYPLDGTLWTLFLEYIVNILYAVIFRHFNNFVLILCLIGSAFLTITLTMNLDVFHIMDSPDHIAPYTVIGGWGISPCHLYIAFARLLYPFFCGMFLARRRKFVSICGGYFICIIMFIAIESMPYMGTGIYNGLYETLCILVLFPLLIQIGAGSKIENNFVLSVTKFLGNISYSIYLTHYPFIYLQERWVVQHRQFPFEKHVLVNISTLILIGFAAYSTQKLYYEPIQDFLRKKYYDKKENKQIGSDTDPLIQK